MKTLTIPLVYLLLIELEAGWNWFLIERLHRDINHAARWFYRLVISAAFWIAVPIYYPYPLELTQWWLMLIWMPLLFWATFDPSLNIMRGRYLVYLGKSAFWDRFQHSYGGEDMWFILKVVSAFLSLWWFYYV